MHGIGEAEAGPSLRLDDRENVTKGENMFSGSSAFSKSSLNIRKFMVHILLKPGNFEHYFTSM